MELPTALSARVAANARVGIGLVLLLRVMLGSSIVSSFGMVRNIWRIHVSLLHLVLGRKCHRQDRQSAAHLFVARIHRFILPYIHAYMLSEVATWQRDDIGPRKCHPGR